MYDFSNSGAARLNNFMVCGGGGADGRHLVAPLPGDVPGACCGLPPEQASSPPLPAGLFVGRAY